MSKGAALGLLTKVYATWAGYPIEDHSKWEEAAKTAKSLIESRQHDLLNDYEQLWLNTCNSIWDPTESLIEISFYSTTAAGGASDACGRIGKWNGVKTTVIAGERGSCAGNYKVVHPFVIKWREKDLPEGQEVFDENTPIPDKRYNLSIANYQYSPTKTLYAKGKSDTEATALKNDCDKTKKNKEKQNYTPAKWDIEKYVIYQSKLINNDKSNVNWYFLRYADVLLMYAEVENALGNDGEARWALNEVRGRVDLPEVTASGTALRDAIRLERRLELALENNRLFDLRRWKDDNGKAAICNVMGTNGTFVKYNLEQSTDNDEKNNQIENSNKGITFKEGRDELFPIPTSEVTMSNGSIVQNPGY